MGLLLFELRQQLSQGFSAFWSRWPRKVARKDAEKAWNKVVTPEDEEPIQQALDWQVPIFEAREPEHIPHAATWLRGRRWEDEKPPPKKATISPVIAKLSTPEQQRQHDAMNRIQVLVDHGMDREDAKRKVYQELGWIKE